MTLILPTGRAVALVAAAPLVALLLAALAPRLWLLGPAYLGVVLLALALDGLLAMPLRRLAVRFQPPDMLFVGETAAAVLDLTPGGRRIPPRIDAVIDHGPTVEMPALLEIASQGAQTIRTEIPLLPRRRGTAPPSPARKRWSTGRRAGSACGSSSSPASQGSATSATPTRLPTRYMPTPSPAAARPRARCTSSRSAG